MDISTLLTGTTNPADQRIIDSINSAQTGEPVTPTQAAQQSAANSLGQQDFLRLLTVQLQQQDPFEPVDNTDMLAQMAQFSALAGTSQTNDTLSQTNVALGDIAAKLDALIAAQTPPETTTPETTP